MRRLKQGGPADRQRANHNIGFAESGDGRLTMQVQNVDELRFEQLTHSRSLLCPATQPGQLSISAVKSIAPWLQNRHDKVSNHNGRPPPPALAVHNVALQRLPRHLLRCRGCSSRPSMSCRQDTAQRQPSRRRRTETPQTSQASRSITRLGSPRRQRHEPVGPPEARMPCTQA